MLRLTKLGYAMLCPVLLNATLLEHALLFSTVFCATASHSILLCFTLLCATLRYSTELRLVHSTLLYCTTLCSCLIRDKMSYTSIQLQAKRRGSICTEFLHCSAVLALGQLCCSTIRKVSACPDFSTFHCSTAGYVLTRCCSWHFSIVRYFPMYKNLLILRLSSHASWISTCCVWLHVSTFPAVRCKNAIRLFELRCHSLPEPTHSRMRSQPNRTVLADQKPRKHTICSLGPLSCWVCAST